MSFKIDSFKIPKNLWILWNFNIRNVRILSLWLLCCVVAWSSGKVLTRSKRKPGPVAKLSSLMTSVVEEITSSSPASSQSSVTSLDDVIAPGEGDDSESTDYVFRIVYMSRPDYVGELFIS